MRYLLIGLLLSFTAGQAQPRGLGDPVATAACAAAANIALPVVVPTSPGDDSFLKECVPFHVYYGVDAPKSYEQARRCALHGVEETLKPGGWSQYDFESVFTVAMIYVNGDGVERNVDVALHAACGLAATPRVGGATELQNHEWTDLIDFLAKRKGESLAPRFDFCKGNSPESESVPDDAYWLGDDADCTYIEAELVKNGVTARLASLAASWAPGEHQAFRKADEANQKYAKARSEEDDDPCAGSAWRSVMEAERDERKQFGDDVDRFVRGDLPRFSSGNAVAAETALNKTYRKRITELHGPPGVCELTPESTIKAERAWLIYREAWIAFAQMRWPSVPRSNWIAFLDKERIAILTGTVGP